jgi:hypothetical protein
VHRQGQYRWTYSPNRHSFKHLRRASEPSLSFLDRWPSISHSYLSPTIVSLSQPRPSLSTSHHRPTYEGGQLPIRWVDGRLTACPRKTAESFIKARTKTQGLPYHLCWSTLMISFGGFSRAVCGDWFVAVSEQGVFFSEGTCVILGNGGMEPFYVLW